MELGFIGVGLMGSRMGKRLLAAGHTLVVCDTSAENRDAMVALGATAVDSPAELGKVVDVIFSIVPNASVLKAIVSGPGGLAETATANTVLIDMSTVDPDSSAQVAQAMEEKGGQLLRMTVSGSTEFAENGTLSLMVSGNRALFDAYLPVLEIIGNRQHYVGDKEQSRYVKICVNMMIGTSIQMIAESLVLGEKAGIEWQTLLNCILDSAAASPIIKSKGDMYRNKDFTPMCSGVTLEKDMDLALTLGKEHGVSLPLTAISRQYYTAMKAFGIEQEDYAAVLTVNEKMAGIE